MATTVVTPSPGFISIAVSDVQASASFYERYLGAIRDTFDFGRSPRPSLAGRRSPSRRHDGRTSRARRPRPRASSCGGGPAMPRHSTSRRSRTVSRSSRSRSTGPSGGRLRWPTPTVTGSRSTRRISRSSGRPSGAERARRGSSIRSRTGLEAVEDGVEPLVELVRVVVAGLHRVLGDELGEVRVGVQSGTARASSCATSAISAVDSNGRFIFVSAKP